MGNLKTTAIALILGLVATGGVLALVLNNPSSARATPAAALAPTPAAVDGLAAPSASVPGYSGPLYDANGRVVAFAPSAQAAPVRSSAVSRSSYRETAPVRRATTQRRSTKKSVAIVAGSAGVGAAIGGLAGGGKGAAIGAISGGTAGFVYDRMTKDRKQ